MSVDSTVRGGRRPVSGVLAFLSTLSFLLFRRGESRRPRRPGFAPALPLLSLVSLLLLALPPLVPEAKAQSENEIFSKTVTLATSGEFTGYQSGSHGSIAPDDDFDIDGTTYTVSAVQISSSGFLHFTARDSMGDGTFLPDDARLRLRIDNKPDNPGDPATHMEYWLGQYRSSSPGQYVAAVASGDGFTWPSGHVAGDTATVRLIGIPQTLQPPPGNAIWTTDITTAEHKAISGGFGYIHADHPTSAAGGSTTDDDFVIKGTTYTVWRLTQNSDNDPNFWVTLTVAAGSPAAATRLEGEAALFLRLTDAMGRSADLDFGDAVYTGTGSGNTLGYVFNNPPNVNFVMSGVSVRASIVRRQGNTAPTASDSAVTTLVDTDYAFAAGDFGFMARDELDELASVKIGSLPPPGRGTLLLDGTAIAAADLPQTVTKAELDTGALVYRPQPSAVGAGFASFRFRVNDGTADSANYRMTVDLIARPPPTVPEAFWSTTVTSANVAGGDVGYLNPDTTVTSPGGTIGDGDFDIDGTTYTVWRITQATSGGGTYFTVAAGATPATVRLPDDDRLILRVMDSGGSYDYELSDATFTGSSGAADDQGYHWAREVDEFAVGADTTVALLRKPPPPPPPPTYLAGFWSTTVTPGGDFTTLGYQAAAHPLQYNVGGTIGDGDFDIDGTTYTVWRLTQNTGALTFTVAAGATPATTRLPDDGSLVLRLSRGDTGIVNEYNLSDATFSDSSLSASIQGYVWNSGTATDVARSQSTAVALLRRTPVANCAGFTAPAGQALVWAGDLEVQSAAQGGQENAFRGFVNLDPPRGTLTPRGVDFDGDGTDDRSFNSFAVATADHASLDDGALVLLFDSALAQAQHDGLWAHVCGDVIDSFSFAASDQAAAGQGYTWSGAGLDWSSVSDRRVFLTRELSDTTLGALAVTEGTGTTAVALSPAFASGTTEYAAWVGSGVESVTVAATPTDEAVTVTFPGGRAGSASGSAQYDLKPGRNDLEVLVTAGSSTQTYTVTVVREAEPPAPDPMALLTAHLTVGDNGTSQGYVEGDYGALTDTDFVVDGATYQITEFKETADTQVALCFPDAASRPSAALRQRLLLLVDGHRLSLAEASDEVEHCLGFVTTGRQFPDMAWGDIVELKVKLTASNATGAPAISGSGRVGETLTASTDDIADPDGLDDVSYGYTWLRMEDGDETVVGTDAATYMPVAADEGRMIKVRVRFTDDAGNAEALTSAGVTVRPAMPGATCPAFTVPSGRTQVWSGTMTVGDIAGIVFGYRISQFGSLTPDRVFRLGHRNYSVNGVEAAKELLNVPAGQLSLSLDDGSRLTEAQVERLSLHVCGETWALADARYDSDSNDYAWPNAGLDWSGLVDATRDLVLTWEGNAPATGLPAVTGTAEQGGELTASVSDIGDPNGLANASYRYQWLRVEGRVSTAIPGATGPSYTPGAADLGKQVAVRVDFTDDAGGAESLTSEPTAVVTGDTEVFLVRADRTTAAGGIDQITYTVTRTGDAADAVKVQLTLAGPDGNDWGMTRTSREVDFPAGTTSKTVNVRLRAAGTGSTGGFGGSATTDGTLTATLGEASSDPPAGYLLDDTAEVHVVVSRPAWIIRLTEPAYRVGEGEGSRKFTLEAYAASPDIPEPSSFARDHSMENNVTTRGGTASVGSDFKAVSVRADFSGVAFRRDANGILRGSRTVTFEPLQDAVLEDDEGLTIDLQNAPAADINGYRQVEGPDGTLRATGVTSYPVTIVDDDAGIVTGGVTVISKPGLKSADTLTDPDTYAEEERIRFQVEFTHAVEVTGAPHFEFTLGSDTREAAYSGGSGTERLAFTYQVAAADSDDDGIFIGDGTTTLKLGTDEHIRRADTGQDAILTHAEVGTLAGHKVDGSMESPGGRTSVDGEARVGQTLTANTTDITDPDGTTTATFAYRWFRVDGADETEVGGATAETYAVTDDDVGKALKVKVSFTDDGGNAEERDGDPTDVVVANTAPAFTETAYAFTVPENSAAGVAVGAPLAATDADASDTVTFLEALGGADADSFEFDAATGQITTKEGVTYDFEEKNAYTVEVTATDGVDETVATVSIALGDLPAVSLSFAQTSFLFSDGLIVGTVSATPAPDADLDVGVTVTQTEAWVQDDSLKQTLSYIAIDREWIQPEFGLNAAHPARSGTVTVSLDAPEAGAAYELDADAASATLTLEARQVTAFAQGRFRVREDAGTATVTLTAEAPPDTSPRQHYSMDWTTTADQAAAGSDFTASGGTARFGASDAPFTQEFPGAVWRSTLDIEIPIVDDNVAESPERFFVTLSSGTDTHALFRPANGDTSLCADNPPGVNCGPEVTILDEDRPAGTWDAPANLRAAAAGDESINLTWTAPTGAGLDPAPNPILGYRIEGSADRTVWEEEVANTGSTATAFTATANLGSATTRHYRVSAVNEPVAGAPMAGSPSNVASATTTDGAPAAPTGLTATPVPAAFGAADTAIALEWTAPADEGTSAITGYRIEWSADGGDPWTAFSPDLGAAARAYEDAGLASETVRHYRVRAINDSGASPASDVVSATSADIVAPAPLLVAVDAAGDAIWITFDEALDETAANLPPPGRFTLTAADGAVLRIESVAVSGGVVTLALADGPEGEVAATIKQDQVLTLAYRDPTPRDDTRALQDDDPGNDAADFTFGPDEAAQVTNNSTVAPTAPGAPRNVAAGPGSTQDAIDVAWDAPADTGGRAITDYVVEVCAADCGVEANWSAAPGDTVSTATAYTHTGLMIGDERSYRVKARNEVGDSVLSEVRLGQAIEPLGRVDLAVGPAAAEGGRIEWTVTATTEENVRPAADFSLGVQVMSADGTATAPYDYAAVDETVTFGRGDFTQRTVDGERRWVAERRGTVAIEDDTLAENAESFALEATVTDVVGTRYVDGEVAAGADIEASDPWGIAVTAAPLEVAEGETREVTLTARVVSPGAGPTDCVADFEVEVELAVGGTAEDPADYALDGELRAQTIAACDTAGVTWTVDLAAALDGADDADETVVFTPTVRNAPPVAADPGQAAAARLTVTERPAVLPGVTALDVEEGGTASYTLVLARRPTGNVTVRPQVAGAADVSPVTMRVVFTRANWNVPQAVTLRAGEDGNDTDETATVTHAVSGADYAGASTTDVTVTSIDNDISYGTMTAAISGGAWGKTDPPPAVHYGEPFKVELRWSKNRTGHAANPARAIGDDAAIRVRGGTARPVNCPYAAGPTCGSVQVLELIPAGTDDVVLTLEPLDCRDNNPKALCGFEDGTSRYTGLAARQRWTFRGIGGPPAAPSNLIVEEEVSTQRTRVNGEWVEEVLSRALYAKFDSGAGLVRWQVEARTAGGSWDDAHTFEGPRNVGAQQRVRLEGLAVGAEWDIRARWRNGNEDLGWGPWAVAQWTDAALLPAPAGLAVAGGGDGRSVTLTWTASASAARYQYRLFRSSRATGDWMNIPSSGSGGANRTSFAVGGETGIWEIRAQLRAIDYSGRPGAASAAARVPVEAPRVLPGRIAVTSDPGADGRYAAGDLITVRVTMSRPVRLANTNKLPKVTLGEGYAVRSAELARIGQPGQGSVGIDIDSGVAGTGTDLYFDFTVREGLVDLDGISIPAGGLALDGAELVDATAEGAGAAATFSLSAGRNFPNHKVDAAVRRMTAVERLGRHVWVHFDRDLDPETALDGTGRHQFGVAYTAARPVGHAVAEALIVKGRGAQACAVARAGAAAEEGCRTVRLTLGALRRTNRDGRGRLVPVNPETWPLETHPADEPWHDDTVTVSYTPACTDEGCGALAKYRLKGYAGSEAEAFSGEVAVRLGGTTTPQITVGDADGVEPVCGDARQPGCTDARRLRFVEFPVRLVPGAGGDVTVDYATANGSAKAGEDYKETSGTLRFFQGETERTIRVPILFDGKEDTGEQFTLTLSNPTGDAALADGEATGTIRNSEVALGAWFGSLPAAHDGAGPFTVRLTFSEAPELDGASLPGAVGVTGGQATAARRAEAGNDRAWDVDVTPSSDGAVTLRLAPASDCEAAGALCTEDGRTLESAVEAVVPGPATPVSAVRVTSARLTSGPGENGTWDEGETATAALVFSGPVTVTGAPTLGLLLDGVRREAVFAGGSGSATLVFSHAVTEADDGTRKIRVAADGVSMNGGALEDGESVAVDPGFATAPYVTGAAVLADASGDGVWTAGETMAVRLAFSEAVTVTGPAPTVDLRLEGIPVPLQLTYTSGSGSAALVFSEEVLGGSFPDIGLVADSLHLRGGRIVSAASGLAAELGHPGADGAEAVGPDETVEGASLTAAFAGIPDSHGGQPFTVELAFSEAPDLDAAALQGAFEVTGGAVTAAARIEPDSALRWTVTVEPDGADDVTITLPATADCGADGAICASGGRPLSAAATAAVPGRARLTARFTEIPAAHGGQPFTVELAFSEEPSLSYRVLQGADGQASAIGVAQGTVTRAERIEAGKNRRWTVTVEPDGADDVTLTLPATADCDAADAICTGDGRPLSAAAEATVTREDDGPFEASLEELPEEHDGVGAVVFEVHFSEAPPVYSYRTLQDETLDIRQGGTGITPRVERLETGSGRNRAWRVTVEPGSKEDLSIAILSTADCDAAGAVCNGDGEPLPEDVEAVVPGPPAISVSDAEAREAPGATVDFAVTLGRAAASTVRVDYATSDGTATAGADYTSTSGTLAFTPGETAKTVSVPVLDDAHDEGAETFTLTLSNPSGGNAWIGDGAATGKIENTDAMPQAWLARFGRTVAEQVIDAAEDRLGSIRGAGLEVRIAGQEIRGMTDAEMADLEERSGSSGDFAGDRRRDGTAGTRARGLTSRDFLTGTAFSLTEGTAATGYGSLWGRGTLTGFDGRSGGVVLDGEVESMMLGADMGNGRIAVGLMLAHSRGTGGYRGPEGSGAVESTLTGLYPYGRYRLNRRLEAWGVAGYASGDLTLTPEGLGPIHGDADLALGAVGLRGVALEAGREGGLELALKSDAMAVRTGSDGTEGLAESEADVLRLRLGLEGTWRGIATKGGGSLVPTLELGVRRDSGDAETGFGLDAGAGVTWTDPARGLSLGLWARGLLTHESEGFRDRGVAGTLAWDPRPGSDLGFSLRLSQAMGGAASGGAETLFGHRHLGGLAPYGALNGSGNRTGEVEGNELDRSVLSLRMGYGFRVFGGRFTATPEVGMELSDGRRDYTLGWRLGGSHRGWMKMEFTIEGRRREDSDSIAFRGQLRW